MEQLINTILDTVSSLLIDEFHFAEVKPSIKFFKDPEGKYEGARLHVLGSFLAGDVTYHTTDVAISTFVSDTYQEALTKILQDLKESESNVRWSIRQLLIFPVLELV